MNALRFHFGYFAAGAVYGTVLAVNVALGLWLFLPIAAVVLTVEHFERRALEKEKR